MACVELEQVSKVFAGGVRAVDAIDLAVADQEFVVLVGPSGCGKSTTLRMIAGLEEVSGGVIRIGPRVVNEVPPKDRHIAMVFQNYALYPHMSVYRNMAFGLKCRGVRRAQIKERVMQAARMLDLEGLLDRKPKALSGGQRQRVAVGRAIVQQPAAFLFDEPLSNLDARLRVTTRAELKRLHQRLKTTTIYVTHDQEEAMTLGDRIVVMKDGRIQQADVPLTTYNMPVNRFVAGFIGMPPMNFIPGAVKNVDGRLVFEEGKRVRNRPEARGGGGRNIAVPDDEELTWPGNGFRLAVPAHLVEAVFHQVGRQVVLGVRPEHLHLEPVGAEGETGRLDVKVNVVEPLGNDMDIHMSTELNDHLVARVKAHAGLGIGSSVRLFVDLRKIHFFEPGETGMNLSRTSELAHAIA